MLVLIVMLYMTYVFNMPTWCKVFVFITLGFKVVNDITVIWNDINSLRNKNDNVSGKPEK